MDFVNPTNEQMVRFLITLLRVSIVLFMFPFFGGTLIPTTIKAAISLVITLVLFSNVPYNEKIITGGLVNAASIILTEIILGIIIGLAARLYFAAIQLAGQMIGFQMGFSLSNILDPETGTQESVLSQFGYWIALLFFLMLNGHHLLLNAIKDSFELFNYNTLHLGPEIFKTIMTMTGKMFELSIKLGAPAIIALLLTSASFGILARVVPQMNVLIVAFPLKIVIGLMFFGISLEILLFTTKNYVGRFATMLHTMINFIRV